MAQLRISGPSTELRALISQIESSDEIRGDRATDGPQWEMKPRQATGFEDVPFGAAEWADLIIHIPAAFVAHAMYDQVKAMVAKRRKEMPNVSEVALEE